MAENDDFKLEEEALHDEPTIEAASTPVVKQDGDREFLDPHYDWVDDVVHGDWLANALPGKVVGDVLSRVPANSPVEHIVNVVRRAYHAHENRPPKAA